MDYGIAGRTAIVTGAGSGIGQACALMLAAEGAKVVCAGRRLETVEVTADMIRKFSPDVIAVKCDVASQEDAQKAAEAAYKAFGSIDILVNNAGIEIPVSEGQVGGDVDVVDVTPEQYDAVVNTNLRGQYFCIQAVVPYMRKAKYGRIVNISSTTGLTGGVGSAVYCASKAGIMAQTKVMAKSLGPEGIIVNSVAPGMVMTPMHKNTPPALAERLAAISPLRKVCVPDDIARVVCYFASRDLAFTGQIICVDGGQCMP